MTEVGYQFERDESVPEAVRRIATEEMSTVMAQLRRAHGKERHEAIHEARKNIKDYGRCCA